MYNTIRLVVDHWCYQLSLWEDELNNNVKPFVCVIKTIMGYVLAGIKLKEQFGKLLISSKINILDKMK